MSAKVKTYSQLMGELQAIIEWFEGEDVDLDEAIAKYRQADRLIAELEDYLKSAENKIKKISSGSK